MNSAENWNQEKMVNAVEYLKDYMVTYDNQVGYEDYAMNTYIDDVIYGLGVSISGDYRFASGFNKFKKDLIKYLEEATNEQ